MTQRRLWDYYEIDSTEYMNDVISALFTLLNVGPAGTPQQRAGRLTGFIATANVTPDEYVDLSMGGFTSQSMITNDGVIVIEDADLDDAVTFDDVEANPRIDIVAVKHAYRDYLPNLAATYVVVKGTAAASPVPAYGNLAADETPIAEVWIDTAPGTGNPPEISDTDIKVLPSCIGQLVARHEPTFGKTNNFNGDSGAWVSMGSNTDRLYVMRNPEDDNQVFIVLNAYYDPGDGKWYQEDASRASILMLHDDTTSAAVAWGMYYATAGKTASAFSVFWQSLITVDPGGVADYTNNPIGGLAGRIVLDSTTPTDLITAADVKYCDSSITTNGSASYVLIAYCDYTASTYVEFRRTSNEGQSWTTPGGGPINFNDTANYCVPGLVGSSTYQTYMLVLYDETAATGYYEVRSYLTTNAGGAWGTPVVIVDENEADVTTLRSGGVSVAFRENGNYICAFTFNDGTNDRVAVKQSSDSGATWSSRVDVYTSANQLENPRLLVLPSGRILIAWYDLTTRYIVSSYSDDGGATWDSTPNLGPQLAAGSNMATFNMVYDRIGDYVLLFYSDVNLGDKKLRHMKSSTQGQDWGSTFEVVAHSADEPETPAPVFTPGGTMLLPFTEATGHDLECYYGMITATIAVN